MGSFFTLAGFLWLGTMVFMLPGDIIFSQGGFWYYVFQAIKYLCSVTIIVGAISVLGVAERPNARPLLHI